MNKTNKKTINFKLRPLEGGDSVSIFENANDIKIARYLAGSFPSPYTINDANNFIQINIDESKKENPRFYNFAIVVNNMAVGVIGVNISKKFFGEMGYWIGREYWNKGIMTKAISEIVKYCFSDLKLKRIEAKFLTKNKASAIILGKNKFKLEGVMKKALYKDGEFHDLVLMARTSK